MTGSMMIQDMISVQNDSKGFIICKSCKSNDRTVHHLHHDDASVLSGEIHS